MWYNIAIARDTEQLNNNNFRLALFGVNGTRGRGIPSTYHSNSGGWTGCLHSEYAINPTWSYYPHDRGTVRIGSRSNSEALA